MLSFALNHVSVASRAYRELLDISAGIGAVGVEVRTDMDNAIFDGMAPAEAGWLARQMNLRILTVSGLKQFDDWDDAKARQARALIEIAKEAGAEAISLIPRVDGLGLGNGERRARLRLALRALKGLLEEVGLIGLVEPLGFELCSLRFKSEAVEVIEALNAGTSFKLVHDTFHHHLAGGGPPFPEHTGLVHISGVVDPSLATAEMGDRHRGLVDSRDRLGSIEQINALLDGGYRGPVSFEAFASGACPLPDPVAALNSSMAFIRTHHQPEAA